MSWSIVLFGVLAAVFTVLLVIDEIRWRRRFCQRCLRRKVECDSHAPIQAYVPVSCEDWRERIRRG